MDSERQRRIDDLVALALILCALVGLGLASGLWLLVIPLVLLTLWQPLLSKRVRISDPPLLVYLLVALPFAAAPQLAPSQFVMEQTYRGAISMSFYLILVALVPLFGPPERPRLPFAMGCTAVAMAAVALFTKPGTFLLLASIWGAMLVVALRRQLSEAKQGSPGAPATAPMSRRRLLSLGLAALAATALTATMSGAINYYYDDVNRLVFSLLQRARWSSQPGFSGSARLGSIVDLQGSLDNEVAVRAWSRRPPGYLRGRAFVEYQSATWHTTGRVARTDSTQNTDQGLHMLAGRPPPTADAKPSLKVQPMARYGRHFFLPLEASAVADAGPQVVVLTANALETTKRSTAHGYGVHLSPEPWLKTSPKWLTLPESPEIVASVDRLLRRVGLEPPSIARQVDANVRRLSDYFDREYTYHVGIEFDPERDPLVQFLDEKSHGHCELFASAGTLALRRLGMPARYVTGFVCAERNPWGELWVARALHAHAWVEYLHPERGWQVAEFTPAGGVPATPSATGLTGFSDWLKAWRKRLWNALTARTPRELLTLATSALGVMGRWLLAAWWRLALVALAGGYFLWTRFAKGRQQRKTRHQRDLPAHLERDRRRLASLERRLARLGFARGTSETLHEYAGRLENEPIEERKATVAFIRDFAVRRYAPHEP